MAARATATRARPQASPREFEIAYSAAEHLVAAPGRAAEGPTDVVLVSDGGGAPDGVDALVRDRADSCARR